MFARHALEKTAEPEPVQASAPLIAAEPALPGPAASRITTSIGSGATTGVVASKIRATDSDWPGVALLQAKLVVGPANDPFEQEADQVAALVVSRIRARPQETPAKDVAPDAALDRDSPRVPVRRKIQRRSPGGDEGFQLDGADERSISAARSGGRALKAGVRRQMERAFDADFSNVRVHEGAQASELSERIDARAFTIGSDIFFNGNEPDTDGRSGQLLLAHELTHTLQQGATTARRSSTGTAASADGLIQRGKKKKKKTASTSQVTSTTAVMEEEDGGGDDGEDGAGDDEEELTAETSVPDAQPGLLQSIGSYLYSFVVSTPVPPVTAKPVVKVIPDQPKSKPSAPTQTKPSIDTPVETTTTSKVTATPEKVPKSEPLKPTAKTSVVPVVEETEDSDDEADVDMPEKEAAVDTPVTKPAPQKKLSPKQLAAIKKENKAKRAQQLKQENREKREAETLAKSQQAEADERDCVELYKTVPKKAEQAIAYAASREVSVKSVQSAIANLKQQELAKKRNWANVKSALNDLGSAADSLNVTVNDKEDKAKNSYEAASAAILLSAGGARVSGLAKKIDLTDLETAMTAAAQLALADPPNWTAKNANLLVVKNAVKVVADLVAAADKYDVDRARIWPLAVEAKRQGTEALQPGVGAAKPAEYWAQLRLAMTDLAAYEKRDADYAAGPHPRWQALNANLENLETAAERVPLEIAHAPFRGDGRVPRSWRKPVLASQNSTSVSGDDEDDEVAAVHETLESIEGRDTWDGGLGGKWGAYFGDGAGDLPIGDYQEYYVRPPANINHFGGRRIVVDSRTDRIYYSWTHYGDRGDPAFVLLKV